MKAKPEHVANRDEVRSLQPVLFSSSNQISLKGPVFVEIFALASRALD